MPGDNLRLLMALPCGKTGDSIASPIGRGKSHIETHVSILRNLITTTRHAGHWQTNLHSIGVDVGVLLLPSSRSSASASARYIRRRCADTINLRVLNSIPRNKITPGPLFKKVNNGSGVSGSNRALRGTMPQLPRPLQRVQTRPSRPVPSLRAARRSCRKSRCTQAR